MGKRNFEIIFNNGVQRQILLLPETPLRVAFFFADKELVLREKNGKEGLYVISHHRGFTERDSDYELEQEDEEISDDYLNFPDLTHELSDVPFKRFKCSPEGCIEGPTVGAAVNTSCCKHTNLSRELNDEQITEDDAIYPVRFPNSKRNLMKKGKKPHLKRPLICGEVVNVQSDGLAAQNELQEQTKAVTKETSPNGKNTQITQKTAQPNESEIEFQSCKNAESNEIEKAESSEENGDVLRHIEINWLDDSVDGSEHVNTFQKEKVQENVQDTHMDDVLQSEPEILPINHNNAEIDDRIERTDRTVVASVLHISNKPIDSLTEGSHATLESSYSETGSSQMCPNQNEVKLGPKTRKCAFCLKPKYAKSSAVKLFRFPKCCEISNMWAKTSGMKYMLEATPAERRKRYFVCSDHFTPRDYIPPRGILLKKCAVPTQNLPKSSRINPPLLQDKSILETMKSKLKIALEKKQCPYEYFSKLKPKISPQKPLSNISLGNDTVKIIPKITPQKQFSNTSLDNNSGKIMSKITHQKPLPNTSLGNNSGTVVTKINSQKQLSNTSLGNNTEKIVTKRAPQKQLSNTSLGNNTEKIVANITPQKQLPNTSLGNNGEKIMTKITPQKQLSNTSPDNNTEEIVTNITPQKQLPNTSLGNNGEKIVTKITPQKQLSNTSLGNNTGKMVSKIVPQKLYSNTSLSNNTEKIMKKITPQKPLSNTSLGSNSRKIMKKITPQKPLSNISLGSNSRKIMKKITPQKPLSNTSLGSKSGKIVSKITPQNPLSNISVIGNSGNAMQNIIIQRVLLNSSTGKSFISSLPNTNYTVLPSVSHNSSSGNLTQKINLQKLIFLATPNKDFKNLMPKLTSVKTLSSAPHNEDS